MKQLLATIVAMPNIDFAFIMLADSPIIPLWITDIMRFVMLSAVFLFGAFLVWSCWLGIKVAALLIKKNSRRSDRNSFKITTIDFWIAWQGPVLLWFSIIFLKTLPLPDLIPGSLYYYSHLSNIVASPIAPALIWITFFGFPIKWFGCWFNRKSLNS